MSIVGGKVVNGRVEVEDFELPEGADVTVFLHDGAEEEELPPELEDAIDESIAEFERGEYVTAEEALREMREILYRRR